MMNQLFYGDNLEVLQKHIGEESVDLCYVDPPFNSQRNYNQIYNNVGKDDIAQSQAFVDTWEWGHSAELQLDLLCKEPKYTRRLVDTVLGFEKILGKGDMLAYLVSMAVRFAEIWRVLKPTGSFYVHCDPTASHYLKLLLDSIFCDRGGDFRNEIIWGYQWGGVGKRNFARKHDVIFWYSKHKTKWTFNEKIMREPYITKDTRWHNHDEGKLLRDIWDDIPIINTMSKERLGYATQKPVVLLERIIKACSHENDTVLDAFCGCGTTVTAAQALKRQWIGIDITYNAISLILKRLKDTFGNDIEKQIHLTGIPKYIESAMALAHKKDDRLRKEFEKWAILTYSDNYAKINDKKGSDKGIDGIAYILSGTAVFSVKSGNVSVKDVRDLRGVVERESAAAGILLTLEEPTKPMLQEAAASGYVDDIPSVTMPKKTPKLQIVTIQELLDGARMNLPLPEAVVKSAQKHKNKDGNQQMDFEDGEIN
ncbi:MAG: restriction endonuclease [Planctomycetaceae bacterium]|jgi:site-specific DNA-methyltransferase (adenine-specific)|nr:restriction endonuclease [Planctomycetaceae bacterium]